MAKEEEESRFLHAKQSIQRQLSKHLKNVEKRLESSQECLKECMDWEAKQHEALLLQSHLYLLKKGMRSITIPDWKNDNQERTLSLNSSLEPHVEVSKRFKASKKLQRGIPHHQERVNKFEKEQELYQNYLQKLEAIETLEELDLFSQTIPALHPKPKPTPKEVQKIKARPYREFTSASGAKIWVGKSAADNDRLTFQCAKGSDWWLHAHNVPGSHVVIRTNKGQEPDAETIQDAVQLALFYSKNKSGGEVCITEQKYVKRFGKGRAGAVHVSKHRVFHAILDTERLSKTRSKENK